ncbi:hypothetical protein LOZ58_001078 [Ophidiomyces ophidiicola]|nr:hypothetical protein LOZ58_001078 [Ophidiomyces ophidiicola]
MGNESSKNDTRGRIFTISGPQGGLQMIPTPERDLHGVPICHRQFNINRTALLAAFQNVASYLRDKNANVIVVAVGGAVNTIYLQNREVTQDVDFFSKMRQNMPSKKVRFN